MPDENMMLPVLGREVEVRADTADEQARTVDVVWTTGARVRRRRFFDEDIDEELSLDPGAVRLERLNTGAPFLDVHRGFELSSILGVVVEGSARIEGGQGVATIRFSEREDVEPVFRDVVGGIIRNISVGYRVHKYEIEKRDGEPELWRAVDWEPLEVSAVPVGADPGAHVRQDEARCVVVRSDETAATAAAQAKGKRTMPTKKKAPAAGDQGGATQSKEIEVTESTEAPETRAAEPAAAPATQANEPAATETAPDPGAIREAERKRIGAIHELGDQFGLERAFTDDLVRRGVSVEQARSEVLDKLAERDDRGTGHTQVSVPSGGLDATVTRREAIAEAILHRAAPQAFELTERAREYRGMGLIDVARECLQAAGMRVRGMSRAEIAYEATRGAGLQSTSDFPLILADVAGKRLRSAYQSTPRTFQRWARGTQASDFKPLKPTQVGNFPTLDLVMEGAEFSYGKISEGRETYQLATYGKVVALTRQAIINDDLRAFDRALGTAGMKAGDLESTIVYNVLINNAALADGTPLFHADHNNLGSASVIDEDALSEAWEAMSTQKDLDDEEYIAARPRFILVPPGSRLVEARKIVTATTPESTENVNVYAGALEVIEEPRLYVTGGPQPWYLAADPAGVDTVEYAHLEGQMEPFTDTRVGFEVDGVEVKVRHDFAAAALEYRGLFKNAGAAPA